MQEYIEKIKQVDKTNIVYIDETGIDTYVYRQYCRSKRGQKVVERTKHNIIFLPAYSPNLNPIEKILVIFKKEIKRDNWKIYLFL